MFHVSQSLLEYHNRFKNSCRWRLTAEGVEIENSGVERTKGELAAVKRVWGEYGPSINKHREDYGVPAEIVVATICTESGGKVHNLSGVRGFAYA